MSNLLLTLTFLCLHLVFGNTENNRRRLSANTESCDEVDYGIDVFNCRDFYDESYWTEEFTSSICSNDGSTVKNITAVLCDEFADNEDYVKSMKLAILNTMYATGNVNPSDCTYWCMYDPLNVYDVGFRWYNVDKCWRVLTGATNNLCYVTKRDEWDHAISKTNNFCPGRTCEAYGDPHVYTFYGNSMASARSLGDFLLFRSGAIRVDVRLRAFVDSSGQMWDTVSGIHATAIEVVGEDCSAKIEVYNGYQTESGEVLFLFDGEEVEWSELSNKFSTCDEICPNSYEINEDDGQLSILFADQIVVKIKHVERMHAVSIIVPYDAFATDNTLMTEEQMCMGDYRRLNCEDDPTICTQYDYVSTDQRSRAEITCQQVPDDTSGSSLDCDTEIETIAEDMCGSCEANCGIDSLVVSCSYDVCASPGVTDAWSQNNEELARAEAQEIADQYCEQALDHIEETPWICRFPTDSPTAPPTPEPSKAPTTLPTELPTVGGYYIVQGKQQAVCEDSTDPACTSRVVSPDEIWNVRCCADTDPGGWKQNTDQGCSIYTSSMIPECETADYYTAVSLCSAAGGRLCTLEELEYPNLCAKGGGCDHNYQMVWSSTWGTVSATVSKYYIVKGNSLSNCLDVVDPSCTTTAVSKDERWKVRCCADINPGDWLQNDGCSVYTNSYVPHCLSTDWDSASELCIAAGGRLCTREELEAPNNCARGGGCGYDRHMVWSSTAE